MFAYCENNPVNATDRTGHAMRMTCTMMTDSGGGIINPIPSNTYTDTRNDQKDYEREQSYAQQLLAKTSFHLDENTKDVVASLDITTEAATEKLYYGNTAYHYSILVAEKSQMIANKHPGYHGLTAEHAYYELQGHIIGKEIFSIENCDVIDLNQSESRLSMGIVTLICWFIGP